MLWSHAKSGQVEVTHDSGGRESGPLGLRSHAVCVPCSGVLSTVPIAEGYKYLGITVSAREGGSSAEELLTPIDQSTVKAATKAVFS